MVTDRHKERCGLTSGLFCCPSQMWTFAHFVGLSMFVCPPSLRGWCGCEPCVVPSCYLWHRVTYSDYCTCSWGWVWHTDPQDYILNSLADQDLAQGSVASLMLSYTKGLTTCADFRIYIFWKRKARWWGVGDTSVCQGPRLQWHWKLSPCLLLILTSVYPSPQGQIAPASTEQQFLRGPILQLLTPLGTSKPYEFSGVDFGYWKMETGKPVSTSAGSWVCIIAHLLPSFGQGKRFCHCLSASFG